MKKLNVLIIGTGAYVCGRGTPGLGTLLPACFEATRRGMLSSLSVASRHAASFAVFDEKYRALASATGVSPSYTRFPRGAQDDPKAYMTALRTLGNPGAVIVATPDDEHHTMALAALKAGKHVLVVKPLTPRLREGVELTREAEKRGLHAAVDYHKRWDWANLQLLRQFREGRFGDPLFFHIEYSQQRWVPEKAFASWIESSSIFQYLGVHYVDLIHFVTGANPIRATATAQRGLLRKSGVDVADAIQALVEWRMPEGRRFTASFLTHWVDPNNTSAVTYQAIKLIGTRGRFESDQKNRGIETVAEDGGVGHPNPYFSQPYPAAEPGKYEWRGYGIDSVLQFLADATNVAAGRIRALDLVASRPSFRQALVATAVSEAVHKSLARDGAWTPVVTAARRRSAHTLSRWA